MASLIPRSSWPEGHTRYITRLLPGCFANSGFGAPTVSRHRTWAAACAAANKNDRIEAVDQATGEAYSIPRQNHPQYGAGRFGVGLTESE